MDCRVAMLKLQGLKDRIRSACARVPNGEQTVLQSQLTHLAIELFVHATTR
jgi:hypothetical protein